MKVKQAKIIIKIISNKALGPREALTQIFEENGSLWATNGFMAIKICDKVDDSLKNKRATIDDLKAYCAIHKNDEVVGFEVFTENRHAEPAMHQLVQGNFVPAENIKISYDFIKLGCDYLGIKNFTLEYKEDNHNLYRLKPVQEGDVDILTRAEGAEVYIMGLTK